jgi:hypothetical protein
MTDQPDRKSLKNYIKAVKNTGKPCGIIVFTFFETGMYLHAQCNILQAKMAVVEMVDKIQSSEDNQESITIN